MRKIFCIGFNKTGTTTLDTVFRAQGWRSCHTHHWPKWSWRADGRRMFERADCFSDGEGADFATLETWFPDALFILNTRDERAWLCSRIRHVFRLEADHVTDRPQEPGWQERRLGEMSRTFRASPQMALLKWIAERRIYEARVRSRFGGSPRFLDISVTDDPRWPAALGGFLARNGLLARAEDLGEVHANSGATRTFDGMPIVGTYLRLVDSTLELVGGCDTRSHAAFLEEEPLSARTGGGPLRT